MKAIAVAVYKRREEMPDVEIVGLVHDDVILLVPEEHADEAAGWLTEIMESVGHSVVNGDASPEKRVLVEAATSVCQSWANK